jgi:hypothetical protein
MNGIKLEGFDIEKLRERLQKMTDAQLLEFGRAGVPQSFFTVSSDLCERWYHAS